MKLYGLQKLTLLDYPGHLAAILFLGGCNFRCPFCQNSSLVLLPPQRHGDGDQSEETLTGYPEVPGISQEAFFSFLKKRSGILEGVCISGGEPCLHQDLPELIRKIRALGYQVKLDTNGTNPQMLSSLLKEGLLDYVAMDIKAGRRNYAMAAGLKNSDRDYLPAVKQSVSLLMQSRTDYEFRTTVVKGLHTEEDFEDIADWISGCRSYALQIFRDGDSILTPGHGFSAFSHSEMTHFLKIVQKNIPHAFIRGE